MPLNEKFKNILSFCLRVGLSAILLIYLFNKIDQKQTMEVLQGADIGLMALAFVIFLGINGILLWRWFFFIRVLDLNAPAKEIARYFFVGLFGNLFLPSSIGGDLIKIIGLCRDSSQKPRVVASVLLDRLSGFAGITLVAIGSFIIGYRFIEEKSILMIIAFMGVGAFSVAAILFNEKIFTLGCSVFRWAPKVQQALMSMHYDIALLKGKQFEGWKAIGISCLAQLTFAFCWYLIAQGLHQNIPLFYFFIFVPIICVVSSFPSIGGLGVREWGAAYLFSQIGVAQGVAVSISLMNFLFMVLVGLWGGAIYVFTVSSRRV
jgi:uncharacterized protein (TIRG00374 family)